MAGHDTNFLIVTVYLDPTFYNILYGVKGQCVTTVCLRSGVTITAERQILNSLDTIPFVMRLLTLVFLVLTHLFIC